MPSIKHKGLRSAAGKTTLLRIQSCKFYGFYFRVVSQLGIVFYQLVLVQLLFTHMNGSILHKIVPGLKHPSADKILTYPKSRGLVF